MCGIVGYAGFTKRIPLDSAVESIKHRGPDDNGIEYLDDIALGNTRLAILDLSKRGHQPMFNHDKSVCVTFNGEIYNFLEVKKLLDQTYRFKSNSDTEVILYAYQKWGFKCLDNLSGMFSFVIYDRKKRLLFGARDRLGQKPLKYYFDKGKLIFASEIKAILELLHDCKFEIDGEALDKFLTLQYVPAPATGFKNIYKLPAGHYFIYKKGKISIKRYWSLNFSKKLYLSDDEWQELILEELKKAVKSHLISDVPVGALLSGGLDSSIIVALASLNSSTQINTFSIGFDDDQFDERQFARIVSKLYNTNHTELRVTSKDLVSNFKEITQIFDEPIADNSVLPTLLVSKLASKKVKVALTGDGGDENFAGYERYIFVNLADNFNQFLPLLKHFFPSIGKYIFLIHPNKVTERMKRFLMSFNKPFYQRYVSYNSFFSDEVKKDLYTADFRNHIRENTINFYKNFFDANLDPLDNALKIDISTYLPDDLLYKTDSASMACGLELRSPFLDHTLMEKIASMPSNKKLAFTNKKKILKKIAVKFKLLPKEIVNRPKHGFVVPLNKWFKRDLKEYLYYTIISSRVMGRIFDKKKVTNYLDVYYKTKLNYENNIFALLKLALWFNKYHK